MGTIPLLDHSDDGHELLEMSEVRGVPDCYVLRWIRRYPSLHHRVRYQVSPSLTIEGRHHINFKVCKADRDSLPVSADLRGCRICHLKYSFDAVDQVGVSVNRIVVRIKDHKDVYIGLGQG